MGNFSRQIAQWPNQLLDPFWNSVVFYSRFEEVTPLDLSQSGHTITYGSSASKDAIDFKFGAASMSNGGDTNGYADIAASDDFLFQNGDFTVEGWVFFGSAPSGTNDSFFASVWDATGGQRSWSFMLRNGGLEFAWSTDGSFDDTLECRVSWSPSGTTWYHVAATRSGNTIRIFIDGVLQAAVSTTDSFFESPDNFRVGYPISTSDGAFQTNFDDVRVTKGVARYTESFTPHREQHPSAAPSYIDYSDPHWSHVVLHTDFETKDIPVDNSTRKHALTMGSGASLDTTNFKFGTTALGTDATANGYAQIADNADFDLANNRYTIEGFVRFPTAPGAADDCGLVSQWDETGTQRSWLFALENQNLIFEHSTNGTAVTTKTSSWAPSGATWYHFAASRDGSNLRFFIDGVQLGTATADTATYHNSTAAVRIGDPVDWDQGKVQAQFDGIRITKGIARYTSNFAPPTRRLAVIGSDEHYHSVTALLPLTQAAGNYLDLSKDDENNAGAGNGTGVTTEVTTANLLFGDVVADLDATDNGMIVVGDPYYDSVVLLTHLDHATPIDVSNNAHTLTVNGATRDTTDKKFGASSFSFNAGTNSISAADSADWDFGSGDFTVELWVFFDATPAATDDGWFIGQYDATGNQRAWRIGLENQNLDFTYSTTGSDFTINTASWAPAATTWYHIAVCRVDGDIIMFIDGKAVNRFANSSTFHNSTAALRIGELVSVSPATNEQRNIDSVRITKGVGRYRNDFTPPTRPHSSHQVIPTSGEFTMEGFVRWGTDPATGDAILAGQWNEGENERGWQVYLTNNNLRFSYSTDGAVGTVVNTDKAWNPAASTWYHWAITRDASNDMRWFIDGTQIGTTSNITATFHDSSAIVALGETEDHVTGSTQVFMGQVRFTSGVARYTAGFVPPQGPFAGRPVDPRDFDNLLVWFDSSDVNAVLKDNLGVVYRLNDLSGNERHASQTTASNGPNFEAASANLNNKPGLSFDNTEWLWRAAEDWMRPTRITMFAVHSPDTVTGTHVMWGVPYDGGASWDTPFVGWQFATLDDDQRFFLDVGGALNQWSELVNRSANVAEVQAMTWDGALADTWYNGTLGTQQNLTDGDIQYGTPNPELSIGVRSSTALGEYYSGDIGEMFSYSVPLGHDAIDILNNYLVSKWGI